MRETVASAWQTLRRALEAERARVAEQIHRYPPPIPACDAQFNHLLERRAQLARGLARLKRAAPPPSREACARLVDQLAELLDDDAVRDLRSRLR